MKVKELIEKLKLVEDQEYEIVLSETYCKVGEVIVVGIIMSKEGLITDEVNSKILGGLLS